MKIYHVHFRKTGGTALRHVLLEALQPDSPFPVYSDREFFEDLPQEQQLSSLCETDFISGHFGRIGPLVPQEFARICVMRDPLRRVVSAYNHMLADNTDPLHIPASDVGLRQAFEMEELASELSNHQSKLMVANLGENPGRLTDRQKIACCLEFLDGALCYGIIEDSQRLLADLGSKLAVEFPASLPLANVAITAGGVDKTKIYDCLGLVAYQNRIDLAVYSAMLARLGH
jgi:hypothetical protein